MVKRVSLSGTCWSQNEKELILAATENSCRVLGGLVVALGFGFVGFFEVVMIEHTTFERIVELLFFGVL